MLGLFRCRWGYKRPVPSDDGGWTRARMQSISCHAVESGTGPEDTAEPLTLEADQEVIERQG